MNPSKDTQRHSNSRSARSPLCRGVAYVRLLSCSRGPCSSLSADDAGSLLVETLVASADFLTFAVELRLWQLMVSFCRFPEPAGVSCMNAPGWSAGDLRGCASCKLLRHVPATVHTLLCVVHVQGAFPCFFSNRFSCLDRRWRNLAPHWNS